MCWASKNRFVVFVSFLTCLFLISHRKCHFYLPGAQKDEHLPFVALTQFRVLNVPAFHFRVCHKTHRTLWAQKARSPEQRHARAPGPVRAPPARVAAAALRVVSHFRGQSAKEGLRIGFVF